MLTTIEQYADSEIRSILKTNGYRIEAFSSYPDLQVVINRKELPAPVRKPVFIEVALKENEKLMDLVHLSLEDVELFYCYKNVFCG